LIGEQSSDNSGFKESGVQCLDAFILQYFELDEGVL
jgi:hypothetical protein